MGVTVSRVSERSMWTSRPRESLRLGLDQKGEMWFRSLAAAAGKVRPGHVNLGKCEPNLDAKSSEFDLATSSLRLFSFQVLFAASKHFHPRSIRPWLRVSATSCPGPSALPYSIGLPLFQNAGHGRRTNETVLILVAII